MTPSNITPTRAMEQDARAWSKFTGTNYTSALRQMKDPLAQGLLGPRVRARQLIDILEDHELIGTKHGGFLLSENGYRAESPWSFNGTTDYIELALITDMLRMFTPAAITPESEIGSYTLKHTAEKFLAPHCSYVTNGRLIWAAAALGLPIEETEWEGPNLIIGIPEREHDYVSRMVGPIISRPQAHHYRPPGFDYLRAALAQAAAGEILTEHWIRPAPTVEQAPLHAWLAKQTVRDDVVGDFATDYIDSVRSSSLRIAHNASELLAIGRGLGHAPMFYDGAVEAIAAWMSEDPTAEPVRTELISQDSHDTSGWGAGAGDLKRYEFACPCGYGKIVEEHDNTPGFREHDVWIDCDRCKPDWRLAPGRSVSGWGYVPKALVTD